MTPRIKHCKNNVLMQLDPHNKFEGATEEALTEACGLLLPWAVLGHNKESMEQNLLDNYQFFAGWHDYGAIIANDGTYSYPRDPDLHPYITLVRGTETLHIYKYGIIAVRSDDTQPFKTTRMD